MGVLSVLRHGVVLAGCGFAFFWLNRKLLSHVVPAGASYSPKQTWKWLNIANSFTHSCITGIGASYCMVVTPITWQDLINGYSEVAYILSAFSVGYFLWDMVDMAMNNPKKSTYELLAHHVMVISCFSLTMMMDKYQGYTVISLLLEVNSIFLHLRQLILLQGGNKEGSLYRFNGYINLGTFVVFRIFGLGWLLTWTLRNRAVINRIAFLIGSVSMSGILVMNFMLLAKVIRSDYFGTSHGDNRSISPSGYSEISNDNGTGGRSRHNSRSEALSKAVAAATDDAARFAGLKDD